MDCAGLNVTVLSNMDSVGFGFISCKELMPDPWTLADCVPEALAELVDAARSVSGASASTPAKNSTAKKTAAKKSTKKAPARKPA